MNIFSLFARSSDLHRRRLAEEILHFLFIFCSRLLYRRDLFVVHSGLCIYRVCRDSNTNVVPRQALHHEAGVPGGAAVKQEPPQAQQEATRL